MLNLISDRIFNEAPQMKTWNMVIPILIISAVLSQIRALQAA